MIYRSFTRMRNVVLLALGAALCPVAGTGASAVAPRSLESEAVRRGVAWLVRAQHPSGGWGQGEEAASMGAGNANLRDTPNVADTSAAILALMRTGSTPRSGENAAAVARGVRFILREVEGAEANSLYVTSVRGTRLQAKLGTYIDTFLAAMVLAEVKGKMPDEASNRAVARALDSVMDRIERNQLANGTWDNRGWAPVLAQAMAAKAVNRAAQAGVVVKESVRTKTEDYSRQQFDKRTGGFGGEGSAGVPLYSSAGNLGAMQDSDDTNRGREAELRKKLAGAKDEAERRSATQELDRIQGNRRDLQEARSAVVRQLGDARFVSGFGSNGGEEFLSYMNIGESLVAAGGEEWERWNRKMSDNVERIQNQDGSWTGHHCITGRNFCTSAALLVLTLDRTSSPIAARMRAR